MKDYGGKGGVTEYFIPSGVTRNSSGTGRADIIYFNAATMTAEVYEIKPLVTYGPVLKYNDQGRAQMEGYASALNDRILQNQWTAEPGTTLNEYFNKTVIDSEMYEGKEIVYHVFEDGMITYYYRDKKPEPVAVPKDAKEKLKEIYRNLGIAWEKNKDLVRILTMIIVAVAVVVVVLAIAGIVSGGSLFLGAAALFLLFTLWENDNVPEQEECVEA